MLLQREFERKGKGETKSDQMEIESEHGGVCVVGVYTIL